MKKINIVKKNDDFNRILHGSKPIKGKYYDLYVEKLDSSTYHFGFSVGKKIGNAVVRNKIRRQTKSIVDKNTYLPGFNCIIMIKKSILLSSFAEKKDDLLTIINKANIVKVKNEKEI